jgi:hypothetical protein
MVLDGFGAAGKPKSPAKGPPKKKAGKFPVVPVIIGLAVVLGLATARKA